MAYDLFLGSLDNEAAKVAYLMNLFSQARIRRVNHEALWEEHAALYLPDYRNSWAFGHERAPGAKYEQFQVDCEGMLANWRFMSICGALLTPYSMLWSVLRPVQRYGTQRGRTHRDLWKDRNVRIFFNQLSCCLWGHRYRRDSNFVAQQNQNYLCLGAFGNQAMFVDELDNAPLRGLPGLRYKGMHPGQLYLLENHQGIVTGAIRQFKMTAAQAWQRFKDKIPPVLRAALEINSQVKYDFLHFVIPQGQFAPGEWMTLRGWPWWSVYISIPGYTILEEKGYRKFPFAVGRYMQAPEEEYGRGPGDLVRATEKTLNAVTVDYLRQGNKAVDPTILLADAGIFDFKNYPGAVVEGAVSADGHPLAVPLLGGNIQVSEKMMEKFAATVQGAFLNDLYPLLFDKGGRQRSAREVIEMANEKGIFLAPTLGRQFGEYLGPLIDRELDILAAQGQLPEIPPILREAAGEYEIFFTSPLARALRGQAVVGLMRLTEMAQAIAQATGNPAIFNRIDYDVALPEMGDELMVPPHWFASDEKVAALEKAQAQEKQRQDQVKALPGLAAIEKAHAITAKAGSPNPGQGGIGGAGTGTPQGGMPMMPGQSAPGGRQFGMPGAQPPEEGEPQ